MPAISAATKETIPNFPLNGQELAVYAASCFESACERQRVLPEIAEDALASFKSAMNSEWVFRPTYIYPGVIISIAFQSHVARNTDRSLRLGFNIEPVFRFPNKPDYPECKPFMRWPSHYSQAPLPDRGDDIVNCFRFAVTVANPNLIRVHLGMPITIQEKVPPKHGDLFGTIKDHKVTYDPSGYEPLPPLEIIDETELYCKKWGIVYAGSSAQNADGGIADHDNVSAHPEGQPPVSVGSRAHTLDTPAEQREADETDTAGVSKPGEVVASSSLPSTSPHDNPKPKKRSRD